LATVHQRHRQTGQTHRQTDRQTESTLEVLRRCAI